MWQKELPDKNLSNRILEIMSGHHDEWQRFLDMFLQTCNARKVRFSISKLIKQGQATFSLL